jgi:hypothetical protein
MHAVIGSLPYVKTICVIPAKAGIQRVGWDEIPALGAASMLGFHPSLRGRRCSAI